jgi:hypothetical protein
MAFMMWAIVENNACFFSERGDAKFLATFARLARRCGP